MHYTVRGLYAVTSELTDLVSGAIVFLNNNVEQARKQIINSIVHRVL